MPQCFAYLDSSGVRGSRTGRVRADSTGHGWPMRQKAQAHPVLCFEKEGRFLSCSSGLQPRDNGCTTVVQPRHNRLQPAQPEQLMRQAE